MLDWTAGRAVVMGIVRSDSPLSIVWHGAGGAATGGGDHRIGGYLHAAHPPPGINGLPPVRRCVAGDGKLAAAARDHGPGASLRKNWLPVLPRTPDADAGAGGVRPDHCPVSFWRQCSGLRGLELPSFPGFPATASVASCRQRHAKRLTAGCRSLQSP